MKKYFSLIIFFFQILPADASIKIDVINKLKKTENINFNFSQKINEKTEKGNCTILYPKKIFCEYFDKKGKILVSNGKSLVIKFKNTGAYYIYPLERTSLNLVLDKEFLISKIEQLDVSQKEKDIIRLQIIENNQKINIFFDKKTKNLNGWEITDIYQNKNLTTISNILENQILNKKIFLLPKRTD
ncbi:LolA family protein [Candidatus Pelagibacter sp.]|uniref:LolA family protein n=1 Tax=Candidatus Pelagibacter sp. TaxID=2024849 RepID=UPI003F84A76F